MTSEIAHGIEETTSLSRRHFTLIITTISQPSEGTILCTLQKQQKDNRNFSVCDFILARTKRNEKLLPHTTTSYVCSEKVSRDCVRMKVFE